MQVRVNRISILTTSHICTHVLTMQRHIFSNLFMPLRINLAINTIKCFVQYFYRQLFIKRISFIISHHDKNIKKNETTYEMKRPLAKSNNYNDRVHGHFK